jgi:ABC-type sugar transport system substrate-binding protein
MGRKGRVLLVLGLTILIAGGLFGQTNTAGKKIVIGVTLQDLSNEWIAMCKDALLKRQKEKYPNVQLIINDAQGDAAKQDAQMNSFIFLLSGRPSMRVSPSSR